MLLLVWFVALPIACSAQLLPTAPGPGQIFRAGSQCAIEWQPDTTGTWKSFSIDLMSGSNDQMSVVTNVVSGLDGASSSSYSWTCPEVVPYSAIYFYQFNPNNASTNREHAWTTRFTIASARGATTSPEHLRQPNGDPIPWGIGRVAFSEREQKPTLTGSVDIPASTASVITNARPTSSHSRGKHGTTAFPSPELTLNVPVPRPSKHTRRVVLSGAYMHELQVSGSTPCAVGTLPTCGAKRRNSRRRF